VKHRYTIFKLLWDRYRVNKKWFGTRYAVLVFLPQVGSMGHVVHFGVFEARNIDALFFMLGWHPFGFNKNALGHTTPNLCFCIWWELWLT
jgi:hypothetical protein